jgi:hypothetical protein
MHRGVFQEIAYAPPSQVLELACRQPLSAFEVAQEPKAILAPDVLPARQNDAPQQR